MLQNYHTCDIFLPKCIQLNYTSVLREQILQFNMVYKIIVTMIHQHAWEIRDKSERGAQVMLGILHQLDKPSACVDGSSFQPHSNFGHYFMESLSIVVTDISKTSLNNYAVEKFNSIM